VEEECIMHGIFIRRRNAIATTDELVPEAIAQAKMQSNDALLESGCLHGTVNLDTRTVNPNVAVEDTSCLQSSPFPDARGMYTYGKDPCVTAKYPLLIPRGDSTLTAITMSAYLSNSSDATESEVPTLWSASLAGARFAGDGSLSDAVAHLGSYALVASAGNLYGVDTQKGPTWEQSDALSGDTQVQLLPIDANKANTPLLVLESDHHTVERLDPAFGATRVSGEPVTLPDCPKGETPVSFTAWDDGKGSTLVCQGFSSSVTVVLVTGGTTYTSASGSITPTGYRATFGGGTSVDIGLSGWAAWVRHGNTTTLHPAASGWQLGDARAQNYPALTETVRACPSGTYPLSLSTWNGGWLLTCGETATTITKFVYVDGSTHGSGQAMSTQGEQSCGTDSDGLQICVSASPAVVTFSSEGSTLKQHSADANMSQVRDSAAQGREPAPTGSPIPEPTRFPRSRT
jgi:hypothetical protein